MKRLIAWRAVSAGAMVAAAFCAALPAHAVVVYSGTVNLAIPNTTAGLYVNVLDGSTFTGPGTFPTVPGPGANYDFNIFGTATWSLFSPTASGQTAPAPPAGSRGYVAGTSTGPALSLATGTLISASSLFNTGTASGSALTTGAPVLFGFRFRNENNIADTTDDTVHFGWARVTLSAGVPGTLIDYAFESTPLAGIQAGVVPEPSSVALMMGGLAGLLAWRRRRSGR
jgi:PEP-CTERM motif